MLSVIEKLIEAVEYAEEEETSWVDYFESIDQAKHIIKVASMLNIDDVDEYELAALTEYLSVDIYELASRVALEECLRKLKADLNEFNSE